MQRPVLCKAWPARRGCIRQTSGLATLGSRWLGHGASYTWGPQGEHRPRPLRGHPGGQDAECRFLHFIQAEPVTLISWVQWHMPGIQALGIGRPRQEISSLRSAWAIDKTVSQMRGQYLGSPDGLHRYIRICIPPNACDTGIFVSLRSGWGIRDR